MILLLHAGDLSIGNILLLLLILIALGFIGILVLVKFAKFLNNRNK
jgi:hypothetical protein